VGELPDQGDTVLMMFGMAIPWHMVQ